MRPDAIRAALSTADLCAQDTCILDLTGCRDPAEECIGIITTLRHDYGWEGGCIISASAAAQVKIRTMDLFGNPDPRAAPISLASFPFSHRLLPQNYTLAALLQSLKGLNTVGTLAWREAARDGLLPSIRDMISAFLRSAPECDGRSRLWAEQIWHEFCKLKWDDAFVDHDAAAMARLLRGRDGIDADQAISVVRDINRVLNARRYGIPDVAFQDFSCG